MDKTKLVLSKLIAGDNEVGKSMVKQFEQRCKSMVGNVAKLKEQLRHSNQHKFGKQEQVSHSKVKSIGSMNMMNQEV